MPTLAFGAALVVSCAPKTGEAPVPDAGSETSTASDPEPSESTAVDPSAADTDATDDTSTGGESSDTGSEPTCGNGQLDPGEQCDDAFQNCEACMHSCVLEYEALLNTTAPPWINIPHAPAAIPDGTSDLVVGSANAVHRVTADGDEVWVQSPDDVMTQVQDFLVVGDAVYITGFAPAYESAVYATYSVVDGSPMDVTTRGGEGTLAGGIRVVSEDELVATHTLLVEETSRAVAVDRRSLGGSMEIWSTTLSGDLGLAGYGSGVEVSSSGEIFLRGRIEVDDTTVDPWIAKVGATGEEIWQRRPWSAEGGGYNGYVLAVSPDPTGGVVLIAALQYGNEPYLIGALQGIPSRVMRLDPDGETTWERDLTEDVDVDLLAPYDVRVLADGRIVVGGARIHGAAAHAWLGVLDADGNLLCDVSRPHDSGLEGTIARFYVDADGQVRASGWIDDGSPQTIVWPEGEWLARIE